MSDQKSHDDSDATTTPAAAPEEDAEAVSDPAGSSSSDASAPEAPAHDSDTIQNDVPQQPSRPSRMPLVLSLGALLVAVIAAMAAGWTWISERGPDELTVANRASLDRLGDSVDGTSEALRRSERQLSSLEQRDEELATGIEDVRQTLDDELRPLGSVPGRLSGLEASLAALQGISSGVRDTWLLAEAEYYMEIANAQLQLAGNPELAKIALELADERIAKIANPRLTDVRRALADELRAIEALDAPDIEGAAVMLASLASAVDSLPLANDVVPPGQRDVRVDEELSGMDRALASLKNAMSDVVSVRRTDQPIRPLLPPDAAYFLRSNLTLQLQAARLALLRGEQTIYEQSLDDAAAWIGEYYDTERTPVASALETVNELRQSQTTMTRIDISRSLTLLRRYLALEADEREASAGPQQ